MPSLRILTPEATVNYITNPELRYATTGWTLAGSTITRTLDYARFGIASLKVVTAGAALNEGAFFRVSSLSGVSDNVTVSAYVRGDGKVRIRLIDNPFGKQFVGKTTKITPDRWTRLEVSGFISGRAGANDVRLYVETNEGTAKARTFYVDGAQMERKPYSTTYCSGSQPGCKWNIVDSGSTSVRTADTRLGGRWVQVVGTEPDIARKNNQCYKDDDDLYVTVLGGMGVAPIQNQIQGFALAPGSYFQGTKIKDRVVTLSFHVKNKNLKKNPPQARLHELRQQLIDLIKPDKTIGSEPFMLEYTDDEATRPLYAWFRYEAGLEGDWDVRNGWTDSFPVRLIAVDPFWYEDNQDVMQLKIKDSISVSTSFTYPVYIFKNNKWTYVGAVDRIITSIVEASDGTIYLCGYAAAVKARIYKWDGASISLFAETGTNGDTLLGMDISQDGVLYAIGNFTSINGVAAARIAKCNLSTSVWTAMGTGLGTQGWAVCVAQNGHVYAGGEFTTAGGVSCYRIARWDGVQWRTVGATSGVSGTVLAIVRGNDSTTLYCSGQFATSNGGGVTYNGVASINITTALLSQMGSGITVATAPVVREVTKLAVGLDGTVYAGGSFIVQGSPGTTAILSMAQYKGGAWQPMGDGFTRPSNPNLCTIYSMDVGKNGEIYVSGAIEYSGTIYLTGNAKWVSDVWKPLEIQDTGGGAVFVNHYGEVILVAGSLAAYGTARTSYIPGYSSITSYGTSQLFPIFYFKGPGTLRSITNTKTGAAIYLDLAVGNGEEIYIDFAKGSITSTTRGDLTYAVLSGSEIRAISLLPSANEVGVLVDNDVSASCQLSWVPRHWSVDAVVAAKDL